MIRRNDKKYVKENDRFNIYHDLPDNQKRIINDLSRKILNDISSIKDASTLLFNLNNMFLDAGHPTSNFDSSLVYDLAKDVEKAKKQLINLSIIQGRIEQYAKLLSDIGA